MFILSPDYYQVKKTKKKGRGVFAKKNIEAGIVIGDYLGRLMTQEEILAAEEKAGACYSMDYNGEGLSIFPLDIKVPGIHLLNHSCSPNCEAYFYYGHTLFFASRRILKNEELTIDYEFDPDNEGRKELVQPCFCGNELCRGSMYTSTKKLKNYGAFCRQETKGQKYRELKVGEILTKLDNYPKAIKDNQVFYLFANLDASALICQDKKLPPYQELRRRLRSSGRALNFTVLGMKILAIKDELIIASLNQKNLNKKKT